VNTPQDVPPGGTAGQRLPAPGWRCPYRAFNKVAGWSIFRSELM